jgi:hypothetical protein
MDDRNSRDAVTSFFRNFFGAEEAPDYSVTSDLLALSSSAAWIGFAIHG